MAKLRMLEATVCGGQRVEAGDTVDASERDAHILLLMGKAEVFTEPEKELTDAALEHAAKASTKPKAR